MNWMCSRCRTWLSLACRLIFLHEGMVVWTGTSQEFEETEEPIVKQFRTGSLGGPIKYE